MVKNLSIFSSNSTFRINPSIITDQGAPIAENFVIFLDQSVTKEDLAKNVLEVFSRPITVIPHPQTREEWFASDKEWYKIMKIKSWKSFIKQSKVIYVNTEDKEQIKIVPTKNIMPRGFIEEIIDKERFCSADDPEGLGQAIIDAFADCE